MVLSTGMDDSIQISRITLIIGILSARFGCHTPRPSSHLCAKKNQRFCRFEAILCLSAEIRPLGLPSAPSEQVAGAGGASNNPDSGLAAADKADKS